MNKIILLTDYQNRFGSKYNAVPYRSGFDKSLLEKYFNEQGYEPVFRIFSTIDFSRENFNKELVIYTSSEDDGYHYKAFIEDVVLGLELQGAIVIPQFKFLRANNNKVFMEILRNQIIGNTELKARYFGSIEELMTVIGEFKYPVVIKTAEGASGTGVFLAQSENDLLNTTKRISRTRNFKHELWDLGRSLKHKGYLKESKYRKKIIVQDFVHNLNNDWKVLVYGKRYYVLFRGNRKNDFKASGSGLFKFIKELPHDLLYFASDIFNKLSIPNVSLDIAYDGSNYYLLEFQAVYFGTTTIEKSPFYFEMINNNFELKVEKSELEKVYVDSIVDFLKS